MIYTLTVHAPEETEALAMKLASFLEPRDLITLEGDLGAGKTTFTKGLARGLGISRNVNSPTFTILKQYEGRIKLNHIDAYRLEDTDEDIGFDELFEEAAVTVVEWAQFIEEYLPAKRLEIRITREAGETRHFSFHPFGERYEFLCKELTK